MDTSSTIRKWWWLLPLAVFLVWFGTADSVAAYIRAHNDEPWFHGALSGIAVMVGGALAVRYGERNVRLGALLFGVLVILWMYLTEGP